MLLLYIMFKGFSVSKSTKLEYARMMAKFKLEGIKDKINNKGRWNSNPIRLSYLKIIATPLTTPP